MHTVRRKSNNREEIPIPIYIYFLLFGSLSPNFQRPMEGVKGGFLFWHFFYNMNNGGCKGFLDGDIHIIGEESVPCYAEKKSIRDFKARKIFKEATHTKFQFS